MAGLRQVQRKQFLNGGFVFYNEYISWHSIFLFLLYSSALYDDDMTVL